MSVIGIFFPVADAETPVRVIGLHGVGHTPSEAIGQRLEDWTSQNVSEVVLLC